MMEAQKSADIGMKRGRVLSNLSQPRQLDLIAEGLPILMKSASDLLVASKALEGYDRGATIMKGHALEEVAKALILVDIVRCPQKCRPDRIGAMMGWFYDHLARLLYVEAQDWKPTNVREIQEYVDHHRKSHYLEGYIGEYIMPNWTIWSRESRLYADIVTYEDGAPLWSAPDEVASLWGLGDPSSWLVCQALSDIGAFTRRGLDIVSSVWSKTDFRDDQQWSDADRLTAEMVIELDKAGLVSEAASREQVHNLYHRWQLPMYRIDFRRLEVSLEDLRAQQNAHLWSEAGY